MHHNKIASATTTRTWLMPSNQRSRIYKTIVLSNENLDNVLIGVDFYFIYLKQNQYNKAMITTISQPFLIYFFEEKFSNITSYSGPP